jgi:LPXTG-motif cell wall-anchored protein
MKKLAVLLIALAVPLIGATTVAAQIPDNQRPPLVTDYANYPGTPQAFLTPGCDFSGVINPSFGARLVATGQEFGPVGDLALLPDLAEGDLVRMAWTDVAPQCIGSAVSFVVKVALGPSFDPNTDQLTGPNGGYSVEFLVAGPGEITFPMPDLARFGLGCDYQLDAIVGIPLQDVGPSGSFFSELLRIQQGKQTADNRTTVISAKNGSYPSCVVPPTPTPLQAPPPPPAPTTTAPTATTTAPTPVQFSVPTTPTTVAVTPAPSQLQGPATTAPATTTTFSPSINTIPPNPNRPPLAKTGPSAATWGALIGCSLIAIGLWLTLKTRHVRR